MKILLILLILTACQSPKNNNICDTHCITKLQDQKKQYYDYNTLKTKKITKLT